MREHFNYFLGLLKAYPKATLVLILVYSVLSMFVWLFVEKQDFGISILAVAGQVLQLIIVKIWVVAMVRDKIFISPTPKSFWFAFLITIILGLFALILLVPMLNVY